MANKQCRTCDRIFSKTEHLRRHERSHTNEKPFQCGICLKVYGRRDVLNRHVKAHENDDGWEQYNPHKRRRGQHGLVVSNDGNTSQGLTPQDRTSALQQHITTSQSPLNEQLCHKAQDQRLDKVSSTHAHGIADISLGGSEASLIDESVRESIITRNDNQDGSHLIHDQGRPNAQYDSFDHWLGDFSLSEFGQDINFLNSWPPSLLPGPDSSSANQLSEETLESWTTGSSSPLQTQTVKRLEVGRPYACPISSDFDPAGVVSDGPPGSFPRARRQWHLRPKKSTVDSWMALRGSGFENQDPTDSLPGSATFLQRRRFDEETRSRLKHAIRTHQEIDQSLPPQATSSIDNSFSSTRPPDPSSGVDMPPAGLLDIALDVYFGKCDPTIPIVHHATFSASTAPTCLLLSLVLTGFNTLGTKVAVSYVRKLLPTLLSMVLRQLEMECRTSFQNTSWVGTMSAAVVVSNLAILLQHQGNEADSMTEYFVTTVLSTTQNVGLVSSCAPRSIHESITQLQGAEERWLAWSRLESAKRVILALADLNLCFSALYGRRPFIQSDDLDIMPGSSDCLFYAETSSKWLMLMMQGETLNHPLSIRLQSCKTTDDDSSAPTARGTLTLVQLSLWETYHGFHTLKPVVQPAIRLNPWQACEARSERDLIRLTLSLSPHCVKSSDSINVNDAVSWHLTCLMLAANCQTFATALEFTSDDGTTNPALEDIKLWAKSPTARRACLHAGEIFAILYHRRIREPLGLATVCAALWASLVMGLYYLNAPLESSNTECDLDLISRFDWQAIGDVGFTTDQHHSKGGLSSGGVSMNALEFIAVGGTPRISGDYHPRGHVTARRIFSHFADLMDGLGTWRLPILSQVLRAASEDLMEMDVDRP